MVHLSSSLLPPFLRSLPVVHQRGVGVGGVSHSMKRSAMLSVLVQKYSVSPRGKEHSRASFTSIRRFPPRKTTSRASPKAGSSRNAAHRFSCTRACENELQVCGVEALRERPRVMGQEVLVLLTGACHLSLPSLGVLNKGR
ncbi:unnamed protein product [Arctogadus glacialis]